MDFFLLAIIFLLVIIFIYALIVMIRYYYKAKNMRTVDVNTKENEKIEKGENPKVTVPSVVKEGIQVVNEIKENKINDQMGVKEIKEIEEDETPEVTGPLEAKEEAQIVNELNEDETGDEMGVEEIKETEALNPNDKEATQSASVSGDNSLLRTMTPKRGAFSIICINDQTGEGTLSLIQMKYADDGPELQFSANCHPLWERYCLRVLTYCRQLYKDEFAGKKYVINVLPSDRQTGGPSGDGALAICFLSLTLDLSPAHYTACTGQLGFDGEFESIGGLEAKLAILHQAGCKFLIIPQAVRNTCDSIMQVRNTRLLFTQEKILGA